MVQPKPTRTLARTQIPRPPTRLDPHLAILTSPLRRCLLTAQVLPSPFLVKLKLVVPPPQLQPQRLQLVPSVLHPRFAQSLPGASAYVICRKEAVELLIKKGSYKRLGTNVHLPSHTPLRLQHELLERVAQELVYMLDLAKSRPRELGSLCPISPASRRVDEPGRRPAAVLRFKRLESGDEHWGTTPLYDLSFETHAPTSSSTNTPVVQMAVEALVTCYNLFSRRMQSPVPPLEADEVKGDWVLWADEERAASLLIALWRIGLWSGEGWTERTES